jgi:hypothetical protein
MLVKVTDSFTKRPMAMAIPGCYYEREVKAYVLETDSVTPRAAMVALKLFPELVLDPEGGELLAQKRELLVQDIRPFDNATSYGRDPDAPTVRAALQEDGHDFFDYQRQDLGYLADVLREHGAAYLGWSRGMGKTLGACALIEDTGARQVLAVVPNTAKGPVWEPEVMKWLRGYFDIVCILPNAKTARERQCAFVREAKRAGKSICWIVHYQALPIIAGKGRKAKGAKSAPIGSGWDAYGEWDMIVGDEIHRIKNPKTSWTKALKKIQAAMKVALSGSIMMNDAEELFSPLQWLFPERYKAKWRDWNDRYLDFVEGYGKICVGVKLEALDQMRQELGVFMCYRRKEDELDLPERVDQDLWVDISPGQRRVYDELVSSCIVELESGDYVMAEEGLPMLTKLRQIATGLDLLDNVQDSTKLDLAKQLIEDTPEGEQTVVFSWYKAACHALADRLEVGAEVIDGDVPQKRRDDIIAHFKAGQFPVLIATIGTLGESQNLQCANNAIFIDRSWNPEDNAQAEDRIYRVGQELRVTVTHIHARDTVDQHRVLPTVLNKQALRRIILGG